MDFLISLCASPTHPCYWQLLIYFCQFHQSGEKAIIAPPPESEGKKAIILLDTFLSFSMVFSGGRILEHTIALRFPGIILRVLRLEVSVYNVYITNQFQKPLLLGGGGGGNIR